LSGGVYTFTDKFATAGISYHYWLGEVASDGGADQIDSSVTLGKETKNQVFLPLVKRH